MRTGNVKVRIATGGTNVFALVEAFDEDVRKAWLEGLLSKIDARAVIVTFDSLVLHDGRASYHLTLEDGTKVNGRCDLQA